MPWPMTDLHSSQVPLVFNIESGHISPQFHVTFYDKFETIQSLSSNQPLDWKWAKIFSLGQECFTDMDYNKNDQPILPPLSGIIRTFREEWTRQPRPEPITPVDFDTSFDNWCRNNQNANIDQNQYIPNDVIPVPGGIINKMMQADPFHAINISGGEPTTNRSRYSFSPPNTNSRRRSKHVSNRRKYQWKWKSRRQ